MRPPAFNRAALRSRLLAGTDELGVPLNEAQGERLLDYLELLVRWNAVYNLTAVRDPAEMVTRHLLDSLAIAALVRGETLIDLGTGPGLPGIPLAILDDPPMRPELHCFVGSKAPWFEITDNLPQYAEYPPPG